MPLGGQALPYHLAPSPTLPTAEFHSHPLHTLTPFPTALLFSLSVPVSMAADAPRCLTALLLFYAAVIVVIVTTAANAAPTSVDATTVGTPRNDLSTLTTGGDASPVVADFPAPVSHQIACPGPELGERCKKTCCSGLCCWRFSPDSCRLTKKCVQGRVVNGLERC